MIKKVILALLLSGVSAASFAQASKTWSLEECIGYAQKHNLSIQQNELNERLSRLTLRQSQLSQLPNLSSDVSAGRSFGRSVDPTTNLFSNASYNYLSASANANVLLFGWFSKRNQINQNKNDLLATQTNNEKLQNDIFLNIANGYLRVLVAREQLNVSASQIALTTAQLNQTQKKVAAGQLPELNSAQLESQLATDSSNYIGAQNEVTLATLQMKALLNIDFETPFELDAPPADISGVGGWQDKTAEGIYYTALNHQPGIKSGEYKVDAAQYALKSAKGALYPTLGLGASAGTNFSTTVKEVTGAALAGVSPTASFVDVNGSQYQVFQPAFNYSTRMTPFGRQLDNNFRQTVAFSLSVPLFNGWNARRNVEQAKVSVESQRLGLEQTKLQLRQDIYKAYADATASARQYYASEKAVSASQIAYDFSTKRYDLGLINIVEYLTTQNTLTQAKAKMLNAKYDYIFKVKLLEFYEGQQLKL
jgi:outer membrane protein